jgi:hypothetical protein
MLRLRLKLRLVYKLNAQPPHNYIRKTPYVPANSKWLQW